MGRFLQKSEQWYLRSAPGTIGISPQDGLRGKVDMQVWGQLRSAGTPSSGLMLSISNPVAAGAHLAHEQAHCKT
jgi:PDZ domain-containing secreted protein